MDRQHSDQAEADSAAQGPALQTIRHELRTPVNHIIGFAEMLLEEAADTGDAAGYAALDEVVATGRTLLTIISEQLGGPEGEPAHPTLAGLHERLAPHIATVVQVCDDLAIIAEHSGPASFVPDLLKIAAAAALLGDLAAGTAGGGLMNAHAVGAWSVGSPRQGPAVLSAASPPPPAGEAILIVDDNTLNRDVLARRLERLGYRPYHAANGRQALDMLRARPFDLVLLDLIMPELDGYGVLQALKADPTLPRVSVIVLSALDDMASIVHAVELGADDYLPKPFDPVLLKARIGACLFKKGLRDREADYLKRITDEKRRADDLLHVVIPIGVSLTVEKNFNRLLEKIVLEAQELCSADG
ncbi:MAG: response regulator, partial [Chloroflexales bacterium]|nr:response regulator [Chloroflexales bacterium]